MMKLFLWISPGHKMDNLTKEQRRKNMQNIRSANTKPERMVISQLRKRKIHFSKNVHSIIGKPDIAFKRKKIAVFIDSDFWHMNPEKFVMPKSNTSYWYKKIRRNIERDTEVNIFLKEQGWSIIRIWESEVYSNLNECIDKILNIFSEK